MYALRYEMHLMSKVLIPQIPGGDPNSYITQTFIPGSVLRGVAIKRFLRSPQKNELRKVFFESDLRFLHAYPQINRGGRKYRSLPTPLSWRNIKDGDQIIYNLGFADDQYPGYSIEKVQPPFCFLFNYDEKPGTYLVTPDDWYSLHIRKPSQGVKPRESAMFRYHSLDTDQVFTGWVISQDETQLENVKELFSANEEICIGRSHQSDYGSVQFSFAEKSTANFDEVNVYMGPMDGKFSLTCLSDVLIRDPDTGFFTLSIEQVLGIKPRKVFASSTLVGGYNRLWNLPIPQAYAIKAGSTFIFDEDENSLEKLRKFVETGLGEKLHEGYGRVAINWHDAEQIYRYDKPEVPVIDTRPELGSGELAKFAETMASRIFRKRVEAGLFAKASGTRISNPPRNAQLARLCKMLEVVLRQYETDENLPAAQKSIFDYFKAFRRPAKVQFEAAKVGSESLEQWVKEKVEHPDKIWIDPLNEIDFPRVKIGKIMNQEITNMTEKDAFIFTIIYVDQVLRNVIKGCQGGEHGK